MIETKDKIQMTNFTDKRKQQMGIRSLGDMRREGIVTGKIDPSKFVNGPKKIDCLERPWHRGDMTGILAGTGIGKTSYSLYILKHILLNNPTGVVAFVSLEMTASEIAEKWIKMTEDCPQIEDRFYIIENYDEQGKSRELNVRGVKFELVKLKEVLNETLIAFVLDHLHEISIEGSVKDYNPICRELKDMTVELDAHGIILSQTTKGKGTGDIPVPKDGCYGTSRYENLMTNILTIFQPLLRVQREADLPILGWQYAKIRYKNRGDKVRENMNYLLYFEYDTENLRELDKQEKADFAMYYEKVLELRQNEEKFKSYQFDISDTILGRDGKEVKITKIVGGHDPGEL
jgi:hypothetical protein